MRKSKKTLAILTIIAMVLMMVPVQAFADTPASNRLADVDRVGTAIAIANNGWTSASTVIVAPADDANLVDALAVAPLAGQENAPILMTYKDSLDSKVAAEITALGATKVIAVGALSDATVAQLKAISGVTVTPVKGADRFETAAKVAGMLTSPAGTFVVAYNGLADALSAASFAAANNYAIMIADTNGALPASEKAVGSKTYTVGGQVTIAGATAFAGADRYATNDAVLKGLTYKYDKVYVANGETLVDALAGSALAAKTQSPIVLANTTGAAAAADVNKNMTSSSQVVAFGGTAVVPDSVVSSIVTGGTVTPPPAATGVSVNAVMTAAKAVSQGQNLVDIGTVTLTANGGDATVTGLKISRTGLSKDTDAANVSVWDGTTRLNVPSIVSNGVADIGFSSVVTIPAGQSKTLSIKVNMAAAVNAGSQIVFGLTDVKTAATVSGNLPAYSGTVTVANVTLGTLTVAKAGDSTTADVAPNSQNDSFAKFSFTAVSEDLSLKVVTLTQMGSAGDADLTNLKLYNGATQVGATGTVVNRKVTFTFDSGLAIANGNTLNLELKGDASTSLAGRNVQFAIQDATDVQAVGGSYGTTIVGNAVFPVNANVLATPPGNLIVSLDSSNPAASTIGAGANDFAFEALKVEAVNEPMQLQKIRLGAVATEVAGAHAAAVADITDVTIKAGDTVLARVQDWNDLQTNHAGEIGLSNPITINPGTPVVLTITADMASNTDSSDTYTLGLKSDAAAITAARMISGTTLSYNSTGTGGIPSNTMTVGTNSITPTFAPQSSATKVFGNQAGVVVGALTIKHNLPKDVTLSSMNVVLTKTGTVALGNLRAVDAATGNVLTNTITSPTIDGATNNSLAFSTPLTIKNGDTISVNILADVANGAVATATVTTTLGATSLVAYTADNGQAVTADPATGGLVNPGYQILVGNTVSATSLNVNYSDIEDIGGSSVVGKGTKDVEIGAATLSQTSAQEAALVKKVKLSLDNSAGFTATGNADISNIRITDGSGNVLATVASLPAPGTTQEVSLTTPIEVPKSGSGSVEIHVLADFSSSAGTGDKVQLLFGTQATDWTITGKYTGQTFNGATVAAGYVAGPAQFTVQISSVTVAKVSLPNTAPSATSGAEIGRFSLTNNGSVSVDVYAVGLTDVLDGGTGLSTSQVTDATLMMVDTNSGTIYANPQATAFAAGAQSFNMNANVITLAPGATKTVSIILTGLGTAGGSGPIAAGDGMMLKVNSATTTYQQTNDHSKTNQILDNSKALDSVSLKSL